ncbi:hypothetical protein VTN77DRAFT_4713 [Rasamsonia byssochlamydoides]|uniref:uncharacterized protein n=1 Tax=Rasamsonia byssochlamydoides TaxID=89139 RepID=UPI0037442A65
MAAAATEQPSNGTNTKIASLLDSITNCLSSAGSSLPLTTKNAPSDVTIQPPQDGISLLDTKSDLLLSYLHHLVFLILFQLRGISNGTSSSKDSSNGVANGEKSPSLREDIVKKLVELRVYLDRGVRPLEGRLKYQIDKVVKAAEDAERSQQAAAAAKKSKDKKKKTRAKASSDESENDDDDGEDVPDSAGEEQSDDEEVSDEEEDDDEEDNDEEIDEMAYRPNISAFTKGLQAEAEKQKTKAADKKSTPSDGIYRPPKIKPTALPTTDSERKDREARRPKKSSVIDEFVTAEMSSAPIAEPSIGSTIQRGGRHVMSQKDREREKERREYEEMNFVRLPKESKKERAKRRAREGGFGGEEFRLLTEGADRIERLTRRAAGSSRSSVLEKSRKRKLTEDGPRGDGTAIGQIFEKRRKKIDSWKKK